MELVEALQQLTTAIQDNTRAILAHSPQTPKERRAIERDALLRHGPYDAERLKEWKRPLLVMYAAALGIRNTSVPQMTLIEAVLKAQAAKETPAQIPTLEK